LAIASVVAAFAATVVPTYNTRTMASELSEKITLPSASTPIPCCPLAPLVVS
jgi:hypothetical protein